MCCPSKATHFVVECGQLRFPQLILSPNSNVHSYVRVLGGALDAFDVSERKSERLSTDEPISIDVSLRMRWPRVYYSRKNSTLPSLGMYYTAETSLGSPAKGGSVWSVAAATRVGGGGGTAPRREVPPLKK